MASDLIESLRSRDLRRVKAAIREDSAGARKSRPVVEAGRLAFLDGLRVLQENGADLNASWRGYRALHALIQERAHGACPGPDPRRVACLEWLLTSGADPELTGGWPPCRAIICAAFTGMPEYIAVLRRYVTGMDGFTACALGDV